MNLRAFTVQTGIVVLTLLALALGGSVDLWAQTILAALAGVLIVLAPPRGAMPRIPLLMAGLFLLFALAAFLPAPSIDSAPWRHYLVFECHIPPPGMRTPQPWLTVQACGLLFVGLVWMLYLYRQPWDKDSRLHVAMGLVFGVALLAGIAAAAFIIGFHVPFWNQEQNRGWFPNRNQTADALALAGVVNYALIFDRLRKRRHSGYFLLLSLIPIVTELVISYSRAGILLFFGGVLLWHLWPRSEKARKGSLKWVALSVALGLVLLAVFLTWGGDTMNRFEDNSTPGASDFTDFRGAIQEDALRFSFQSPILGVGLGNFEPLFSFSRIDSINANRAIHPESDWLWMACEMGWLAPMILLVGIGWWIRRCFPLEGKPGESMRLAFIVSLFIFLAHGLVDVSGHRTGSLWVGLLLAGMALSTRDESPSRWTPLLFRSLGGLVLLVAAWWFCSLRGMSVPPTTATLAQLKSEIIAAPTSDLEKSVHTALSIAPLDWNLYLQLANAEVYQPGKTQEAQAHFETARALNPYWIELGITEGQTWLSVNEPDLCVDAWRDCLNRAGPQAPEAFREMIGLSPIHSVQREGLAELAFNRIDYLLLLLPSSPFAEAEALIDHLLEVDPHLSQLSEGQRAELFSAWWKQGNQVRLMEILGDHPEWKSETWIYEARFAAKENDFQHACEMAARWVQPPVIPQSSTVQPIPELQADFKNNPDSLTAGLILYFAQMNAGSLDDALATLQTLLKMPDHPAYLAYLEAQIYAGKKDWPSAWAAWQSYLNP
jgi:O-antigen ligase/tetratricopeptide (TPR) repeat protein